VIAISVHDSVKRVNHSVNEWMDAKDQLNQFEATDDWVGPICQLHCTGGAEFSGTEDERFWSGHDDVMEREQGTNYQPSEGLRKEN
jgi:hypothetical protein